MGDSSVSSDSAGDRSISPTRSDDSPAVGGHLKSSSPIPPSPVLVSKRLAEEAVAKRNSRLMMSQQSVEAAAAAAARNADLPTKKFAPVQAPNRHKKRHAPPPPPQTNGHQVCRWIHPDRAELSARILFRNFSGFRCCVWFSRAPQRPLTFGRLSNGRNLKALDCYANELWMNDEGAGFFFGRKIITGIWLCRCSRRRRPPRATAAGASRRFRRNRIHRTIKSEQIEGKYEEGQLLIFVAFSRRNAGTEPSIDRRSTDDPLRPPIWRTEASRRLIWRKWVVGWLIWARCNLPVVFRMKRFFEIFFFNLLDFFKKSFRNFSRNLFEILFRNFCDKFF